MGQILDGKALAQTLCEDLKKRVDALTTQGITPKLAVILVGEDPASQLYVRSKGKRAAELGILAEQYTYPASLSEGALLDKIRQLNQDDTVHGILVQLPLPGHLDPDKVIACIDPQKDVDGFHVQNAGALLTGQPGFIPCTPKGILALVKRTGLPIAGKRCVVVGRSNIVGKPVALLMLREDATVTICHSHTKELGAITREADILIAAVGKAGLITADMVKEGAVVIDVGQVRIQGKWQGDVDFGPVCEKAAFTTPVPGGVGPMTIAMLMDNTVESAQRALQARLEHGKG